MVDNPLEQASAAQVPGSRALSPELLARFQEALRRELQGLGCPIPGPLVGAPVFPRRVQGRATLVHWRQGDSSPADWAVAIRKPHGWCLEIPQGVFLLDLDRPGALETLLPRLSKGFGLVESSPAHYHIWLCGEAPPAQHLGHVDSHKLEIHGPGRLATLPPTRHVDTGRPYRWLRPFLGNAPTRPQDLGIVVSAREPVTKVPRDPHFPPAAGVPLHCLMAQFTGQEGKPQGQEWAFHCPHHDDSHPSLMVNDPKGLFYCHAVGCGLKGNRRTLESLLGIKPSARRRRQLIVEVPL